MLQPKRTKYRKVQKGRNVGFSWAGSAVSFGEYGLKATTRGQLTARQIEAGRRSISRYVKRVAPVQPGRMLFDIEGVTEDAAREAFRLAAAKLSVKTTFVTRTVR